MFKITITEVNDETNLVRYEQTVDALDMQAIINAVNTSPANHARQRALRSDAGKPRDKKEVSG